MTIAGEILAAAGELAGPSGAGRFTRKMTRDHLGADKRSWDYSYSPIFQGMRDDCPDGAPDPGKAYRSVFHRVERGWYELTDRGRSRLNEMRNE